MEYIDHNILSNLIQTCSEISDLMYCYYLIILPWSVEASFVTDEYPFSLNTCLTLYPLQLVEISSSSVSFNEKCFGLLLVLFFYVLFSSV